ncbi:MAG: glycosyltransferase family 1 protein [Rhodocyclaceae bacterium]|nr:glycosyltransferase family 1 protein [Rhodocyclaceae bacterium]
MDTTETETAAVSDARSNSRPNTSAGAQPLTIAIVTETYLPEINGVAMTLGRLIDGLRRQGHNIQLIRPRQSEADTPRTDLGFNEILVRGIPIPRYSGLQFGLPAGRRLHAMWRRTPPDIVHVVTEGPLGMSAVGSARKLGLPMTSSFHTNFHRYSKHYGFGWMRGLIAGHLRKLHNRTAATFVPTKALAAELGADGFGNLRVMARGVDTTLFSPLRRSPELRKQWGLSDDNLAVLYVGRLAAEKNLRMVVQAFSAIQARCPGARLIFVGDGPMSDKLRQKCPDAVFCGSRRGEDLAAHYASGDLFLFPSLTETFGNVTTEALASGLCVVAYAHAAAGEVIDNGYNGVTVAAGDEEAYIAAVIALIEHPEHLTALRSRAASSMQHFDWRHIVDTFATTLGSVVKQHARRQHGTNDIVLAPD